MTNHDSHTFSNYINVVVKHSDLELHIDFETNKIRGKVIHHINNITSHNVFILDIFDIKIRSIFLDDDKPTSFTIGKKDNVLGSALSIDVKNDTKTVSVLYETSIDAPALQWLPSEQTTGKVSPMLFTQSQAILARSWIPCQDTPAVKFTWLAKVTTSNNLPVVMSGLRNEMIGGNEYRFEMTNPVPSYLLALCAGNLKYKAISNRCGIYAEPEVIDSAVLEFIHVDDMVHKAEKLYGEYLWTQFDLLVLPSSFPFGGMENPCLTFVTPTLLAGDRSLTNVIAHELAHSWSGNLVTNASWNDFWLNEGFTVYFERRIMAEIEDKAYAELLAYLGYIELLKDIEKLGEKSKDTCLKLQLENRDPDEGMTLIAYEKGYLFLKNIELIVGQQLWDDFVKSYFKQFSYKSLSTEDFLEYLNENLIKGNEDLKHKINAVQWVYKPGMPANAVLPQSKRYDNVKLFMDNWMHNSKIDADIITLWTPHEWVLFIMSLPKTLSFKQIEKMDKQFGFSLSGNAEILFAWYLFAINNNYDAVNNGVKDFLLSVGRRKFVEPLYRALSATEKGKQFATEVYKKARCNYHFVTSSSVDEILT